METIFKYKKENVVTQNSIQFTAKISGALDNCIGVIMLEWKKRNTLNKGMNAKGADIHTEHEEASSALLEGPALKYQRLTL